MICAMSLMNKVHKRREVLTAIVFLSVAVWLLFPFIKIDSADYAGADSAVYRLAVGLMIMLFYVGKWFFDVLSPQGLGRKVSSVKAVLLVAFCVVILTFVIFIVFQAGSLYIQSASQQDTSNLEQ